MHNQSDDCIGDIYDAYGAGTAIIVHPPYYYLLYTELDSCQKHYLSPTWLMA